MWVILLHDKNKNDLSIYIILQLIKHVYVPNSLFFFFNIPMKEIVGLISCFMLGNTESS